MPCINPTQRGLRLFIDKIVSFRRPLYAIWTRNRALLFFFFFALDYICLFFYLNFVTHRYVPVKQQQAAPHAYAIVVTVLLPRNIRVEIARKFESGARSNTFDLVTPQSYRVVPVNGDDSVFYNCPVSCQDRRDANSYAHRILRNSNRWDTCMCRYLSDPTQRNMQNSTTI